MVEANHKGCFFNAPSLSRGPRPTVATAEALEDDRAHTFVLVRRAEGNFRVRLMNRFARCGPQAMGCRGASAQAGQVMQRVRAPLEGAGAAAR